MPKTSDPSLSDYSSPTPLEPDIPRYWTHEDELPDEITDEEYQRMYPFSRIIQGVRMFPYTPSVDEMSYTYYPDVVIEVPLLIDP